MTKLEARLRLRALKSVANANRLHAILIKMLHESVGEIQSKEEAIISLNEIEQCAMQWARTCSTRRESLEKIIND